MALADILARVRAAELAAGRLPGSVTLIAVSKVQPPERVIAALDQGQRIFGENYVQEAAGKWPDLQARYPGTQIHMIGPLQTNKAKQAFDLFDAIQTVDRASLAEKLARLAQSQGRCPDLFVQINTGAEPQKAGILPANTETFLKSLATMDLHPKGLMCIPPEGQESTAHFQQLADLAAQNGLTQLSMGMSSDFEQAIANGATHVRVGSALFGARDYQRQ